jgi:hypothetical protein
MSHLAGSESDTVKQPSTLGDAPLEAVETGGVETEAKDTLPSSPVIGSAPISVSTPVSSLPLVKPARVGSMWNELPDRGTEGSISLSRRRSWLQFRLRTLLGMFILAALLLGQVPFLVHSWHERALMTRLGAVDAGVCRGLADLPPWLKWICERTGRSDEWVDYFPRIRGICFNSTRVPEPFVIPAEIADESDLEYVEIGPEAKRPIDYAVFPSIRSLQSLSIYASTLGDGDAETLARCGDRCSIKLV